MIINLKVTKVTSTETSIVLKLTPTLVDALAGDEVSGELFISTAPENPVMNLGEEIVIEFAEEVPPEIPPEEPMV